MWIATQDDQMVRSYRINHSDGSISPIGTNGSPVATGLQPTAMAVARNGPNVFIANDGDSTISQYVIGSDGSLISAFAPSRVALTPAFDEFAEKLSPNLLSLVFLRLSGGLGTNWTRSRPGKRREEHASARLALPLDPEQVQSPLKI